MIRDRKFHDRNLETNVNCTILELKVYDHFLKRIRSLDFILVVDRALSSHELAKIVYLIRSFTLGFMIVG